MKINTAVLKELAAFIEGIFVHTAPTVVTAVEQAAAGAAVASAESDPKVKAITTASIALLTAAKDLKTTITANAPDSSAPSSSK